MFLVLFLVFLVFFLSHHLSMPAPCGLLCTLLYLLGSGFGVAEEILQQRKGKKNKYIFCLVLNFSQKQPLSFHHFRSSLSGPSYASDANWQKKGERVGKRSLTAPRSFSFSFPSRLSVGNRVWGDNWPKEREKKRGHRLTHPGLAIFSSRPISS